MNEKPIDELLHAAYPGGIPPEVAAYFAGEFQTATERRRAVKQIEQDGARVWERDERRRAELAELEAEKARHLPKYQALKAKLAGPMLRIEPVEVGAMLADLSGYQRVLDDLTAAIDSLAGGDDAQGQAFYRLGVIARAIDNFPAVGLGEVLESVFPFLPERLQARVDKDAWARAAALRELERIERAELAALRAEKEEAAAEALAAKLAEIERASIEELLTEAFPDVYERAAVRGLFLSTPAANFTQGQIALEGRFNVLRMSRAADDPERRIIERLRDALSRGEKIDQRPASDEVRLRPQYFH